MRIEIVSGLRTQRGRVSERTALLRSTTPRAREGAAHIDNTIPPQDPFRVFHLLESSESLRGRRFEVELDRGTFDESESGWLETSDWVGERAKEVETPQVNEVH